MPESTAIEEIRLTVTPDNVASLCSDIRALAREGALRIVYVADCDAAWDGASEELWRREHERLATWMIGARSAGQRLPELPAWQAIAGRLVEGAEVDSDDAGGLSGDHAIARRLLVAQVAAVRELGAARGRPVRAKPAATPLVKSAMLAAAVAGMAACQATSAMGPKPDAASDTNQTRDVGIGGGICAIQTDRDALAPADVQQLLGRDASDEGSVIDGDQADAADANLGAGGVCPAPIGGIC
jgi:hypothetical protein